MSQDTDGGCGLQDKGHSAVVLKAMGRAINKTVTIGKPKPSPERIFVSQDALISNQNGTSCLGEEPWRML